MCVFTIYYTIHLYVFTIQYTIHLYVFYYSFIRILLFIYTYLLFTLYVFYYSFIRILLFIYTYFTIHLYIFTIHFIRILLFTINYLPFTIYHSLFNIYYLGKIHTFLEFDQTPKFWCPCVARDAWVNLTFCSEQF